MNRDERRTRAWTRLARERDELREEVRELAPVVALAEAVVQAEHDDGDLPGTIGELREALEQYRQGGGSDG